MQTNKVHWASLLTLIALGLGVSVTLLIALGMSANSIIILFTEEGDAAGQMISAFAFGFVGAALLLCSWFVLQKFLGREQAETVIKFPFAGWQIAAVIALVIMSVAIGAVVVSTQVTWLAWLFLPILTIAVIVPPIWILFGIGSKDIELGQRWRVFSVFGLSMTLGPLLMIVMEIVLLLAFIIIAAVYISVQEPALFQEIARLRVALENETNEEVILKLLAPYFSSPSVIAVALAYIAVFVPLIEELFKPLAVWIFARKIESPAQGFAMGLLSGASFALVESLNASGAGTESWPVIVTIRAGTSMLHIMATGLVGWGIVSAFRERRILRLFAAYFSAVLIHGVWNACAVGAGFSMIGEVIGKPEWLVNILPATAGGMFVLAVGMFLLLPIANKTMRISSMPVLPSAASGAASSEGDAEGVR
ncbi:hypothetical protein ANAEL_01051 [Anaerolineales bacterium]|nr:hypothetical protein ANAEL_01051 [Anaerolineales bacterium]